MAANAAVSIAINILSNTIARATVRTAANAAEMIFWPIAKKPQILPQIAPATQINNPAITQVNPGPTKTTGLSRTAPPMADSKSCKISSIMFL